jgi:hypothetical protein
MKKYFNEIPSVEKTFLVACLLIASCAFASLLDPKDGITELQILGQLLVNTA